MLIISPMSKDEWRNRDKGSQVKVQDEGRSDGMLESKIGVRGFPPGTCDSLPTDIRLAFQSLATLPVRLVDFHRCEICGVPNRCGPKGR